MRVASEADIGLSWRDSGARRQPRAVDKVIRVRRARPAGRARSHADAQTAPGRRLSPLRLQQGRCRRRHRRRRAAIHRSRAAAAARLRAAAAEHTFEQGAERIRAMLDRVHPPPLSAEPRRPSTAHRRGQPRSQVLHGDPRAPAVAARRRGPTRPPWPRLNKHDPAASGAGRRADLVICEWCGPNAVWYSRHRRPGQRLIIRLHRFELDGVWPSQVAIDAVDRVVCVSESYAALTREPDRLAGAEGGPHPELGRQPRPRPTEARWRAVPPGPHRDGTGPQAPRPGPRRA